MHGDSKTNAAGKFRASSLVPRQGNSILVRLEFEGSEVVQTTLTQVPLSMQHDQTAEPVRNYKGRNLNEQEKAVQRELDTIVDRESKIQERQQTVEVIEAMCRGVEVSTECPTCMMADKL